MTIQSISIVDAARDVLREHGYFVDNLWHMEDINFLCEQSGLGRLTLSEAMAVFDIANAQFDGEDGISWPQLEKALETYFQRRKLIHLLCETPIS